MNLKFCFKKFNKICILFGIILGFVTISCIKENQNDIERKCIQCERIDSLISLSKSKNSQREERIQNLDEALKMVELLEQDSLKIEYLFKISNSMYSLKEYAKFKSTNFEFYELSLINVDSMKIADYYWNMGSYYSDLEVLDSAYYSFGKARRIFQELDHRYYTAKMEYNIAFVLKRVKNYVASESYAFRAIANIENLDKKLLLYRCYNHLGLLYYNLNDYEHSIQFHMKAKALIKELKKKDIYLERSLNNLSLVYRNQQKYPEAIAALDEALLNPELPKSHPKLYARLVDNRAYCRFLQGDLNSVLADYNIAMHIRDSLDDEAGISLSKSRLAEYWLNQKDSSKATTYAKQALNIARDLHLNSDILSDLTLLSKADPMHASDYMEEYITLKDSLLLEERRVRDKFTRIQFETEGYIAENKDLKKKNIWISLTSIMAVASLSLLFFWYRQKAKNKSLLLEQEQQKTNEEIYELMLKQQNKEEEGRIQERVRISEELHDGILARLFSVRIGLGFVKNIGSERDTKRYEKFLKELQLVEKEIRNLSHALKTDELSAKKDFPKFLSILLMKQSRIGKFTYELNYDDSIAWNLVEDKIKLNLYRIVQEAIFNIIKHADSTEVKVSFIRQDATVELTIVDNGKGFDTNRKSKGIGLKNMKSRAHSIGAVLSLESIPHKGTNIKVIIPTKTLYHETTT